MTTKAGLVLRLVLVATFLALTWKFRFLLWTSATYFASPIEHRLFPSFFEAPSTFRTAYALAVITTAAAALAPAARLAQLLSVVALASVTILCLHIGSYNDATFTTAWWVMLWATWFAGQLGADQRLALRRGARLSRGIVSVVFLGGAVGKWTMEYWSGQVLYEIYFVNRDFWLFNMLRNTLDPADLRTTAAWYSRGVILVESGLGLGLWLLPSRVAAAAGTAAFIGIALLSNDLLFSVLLSVAGLAAVGFWDTPTGATGEA